MVVKRKEPTTSSLHLSCVEYDQTKDWIQDEVDKHDRWDGIRGDEEMRILKINKKINEKRFQQRKMMMNRRLTPNCPKWQSSPYWEGAVDGLTAKRGALISARTSNSSRKTLPCGGGEAFSSRRQARFNAERHFHLQASKEQTAVTDIYSEA